jgi:TonB family protein
LTVFLWLAGAAQSVQATQKADSSADVPAGVAALRLVRRVDPDYPLIAKELHLQGSVLLKATISPEGRVTNLAAISGHPILISAALDAVKQWQYQPFLVDGRPTAVNTTIKVEFSLGASPEGYKKELQAADVYFIQEDKCRTLVTAKQFAEAEPVCKQAIEVVEKLDAGRKMERVSAYQLAGHSLFYQRKFADALILYRQELIVAQSKLKPYEAELGYAYHHVAMGLHATGDLSQARSYYELAETTLERAREHIGSEFLKNRYSASIKSVLTGYALLLRQSGDESGAQAAEAKANSIVVRTDLKEN